MFTSTYELGTRGVRNIDVFGPGDNPRSATCPREAAVIVWRTPNSDEETDAARTSRAKQYANEND
jgi:hypothetical protein